jgi:hypothetical protein
MRFRIALVCLMVGVLGVATTADAQSTAQNVVLEFDGLAPLDESVDGHYEGWAIVGGSPVSTGKFNVDASGDPVELGTGAPIAEFAAGQDITGASAIKISLEPVGDADPAPAPHIVLTGGISMRRADLLSAVPDLSQLADMATGAFILATPSDNATAPDNDDMGIWFLRQPGPTAGFEMLPDLGPHWRYEGWVVDMSGTSPVPYSTGRFGDPTTADANAAGCNGGGPPFPGEDFVPFHCGPILTLDGGDFAAVLSIEPEPDPNPAPFQWKPMAGPIPTDAVGMSSIAMTNQVDTTFPSGMATLFEAPVTTETTSMGSLKASYRR